MNITLHSALTTEWTILTKCR